MKKYKVGLEIKKTRKAAKKEFYILPYIIVYSIYLMMLCGSFFVYKYFENKQRLSEISFDRVLDVKPNSDSVKFAESVSSSTEILKANIITYKGAYVNKYIIKAIDDKFSSTDAKKLKTIMLAECAQDYNIDGVATYECKLDTINYNKWNDTWDCGALQINQKTKCTESSFRVHYQVEMAYNKLNSINNEGCGGWNCWSTYKFKDSKAFNSMYNYWNNK